VSDPKFLRDLHERRNRANEAARAVVDDAIAEGRSNLTAEEEVKWKRADDERREADDTIRAALERDKREAELDAARASVEAIVRPDIDAIRGRYEHLVGGGTRFLPNADELAAVFEHRIGVSAAADIDFRDYRIDVSGGMPVVRSIHAYAGAGTLGGLAPTLTAHTLYQVLLDQGAVWQLGADVQTTEAGNPVRWPKATAYGTATITAEGVAMTESDATLGSIITTPVAYKHLTKVSNEIVSDSVVDIAGFVAQATSKAMARSYGPAFATGSGTGEPQGYMTAGSITVQAAGTATPDAWIRLQHSVAPPYRRNGRFVTNDGNASYVRRLRADAGGTTGPWLVSPPETPGALEMAFGAPLVIDNNIAAHGSAVKSLAFGDFGSGYLIHDAGYRFERSDDAYFGNDQVGFRGVWRLDGRVRDTAAYGIYQATAN